MPNTSKPDQLPRVLVLASQKGGAGKTTLAAALAVEAERAGDGPAVLLDLDPQGSLADWCNSRQAATPAFAVAKPAGLDKQIQALGEAGMKLVVIDTPPSLDAPIRQAVTVADLVLIPTRPSPLDLRAVGGTVDIAEAAGKRPVFVINGAAYRARISAQAAIALSQHGAVAPGIVHQRTDYAASMIDGRTAPELRPDHKSAAEVQALYAYLRNMLLA
jgi:chromosome partitioning protein